MKFKIAIFLAIILLASSRLVLKKEFLRLREQAQKLGLHRHNHHDASLQGSGSTANPVQGVVNATSGYLSTSATTASKLFYVFYQQRQLASGQNANEVPIVIWLQGGPGGSSMLGNFFEMGPWNLAPNSEGIYAEVQRPLSWNDYYNLMFVDNPVGAGYSYAANGEYVTNEDEVAADFVQALVNFYQLATFAGFKNTPLYIFGESYGGHYIPSIAKGILQYNAENPSTAIPLKGIGIGDGWTDPVNQLSNNNLFSFALGLVDYLGEAKVAYYQTAGVSNINAGNWEAALSDFDNLMSVITDEGGDLNVYNFRDFGGYNDEYIGTFMNYEYTCARYNVLSQLCGNFEIINTEVYSHLSNDFMQSVADRVAFVVEQIPVLLYNGQDDIIVNSPSAQNWIGQLNWSGQQGFYNSEFTNFVLKNGTDAGFTKQYENLQFTLVNKAGHLAPYDQIESTVEMLTAFIERTSAN